MCCYVMEWKISYNPCVLNSYSVYFPQSENFHVDENTVITHILTLGRNIKYYRCKEMDFKLLDCNFWIVFRI